MAAAPAPPVRELHRLARLYDVQTAYTDAAGRRRNASPESLLAVMHALGAPLGGWADVDDALRRRRELLSRRVAEPVAVVWGGGPGGIELRRPAAAPDAPVECVLELEAGQVHEWIAKGDELHRASAKRSDVQRLRLPGPLPFGYHHLRVRTGGTWWETLIICAPRRAYDAAPHRATKPGAEGIGRNGERSARAAGGGRNRGRSARAANRSALFERPARKWGVFMPLYALHSRRSWGTGDLGDLRALVEWTGELGGSLVGTLPLLPSFPGADSAPFDPSPYAPASRLFWNELYLDVAADPNARTDDRQLNEELRELRGEALVDYERAAALKRRVLSRAADGFFVRGGENDPAFQEFLAVRPRVEDYARFRAAAECRNEAWPKWPERLRSGTIEPGDYREERKRYHTYAQWLLHRQLRGVADAGDAAGAGLYLDLPLGVHPGGYDAWRERERFADEVTAGAPPDPFFSAGQDWGFRPLDPHAMRERGYDYTIECLRNHLRYAGMLRLDHVMALHRLFWIPRGAGAEDGVYVRYPAEELYAILALESHRHRSVIVGEDLGTVTREVRRAMSRHGLKRMHVVQYEISPGRARPLPIPPRESMASLNTHDMPTFAGFWTGRDIDRRLEAGLLSELDAGEERRRRAEIRKAVSTALGPGNAAGLSEVLDRLLEWLAASRAEYVLVNLEDLWLESRPQNVPGTGPELPNWRRKARYGIEEFRRLPDVREPLERLNQLRRGE